MRINVDEPQSNSSLVTDVRSQPENLDSTKISKPVRESGMRKRLGGTVVDNKEYGFLANMAQSIIEQGDQCREGDPVVVDRYDNNNSLTIHRFWSAIPLSSEWWQPIAHLATDPRLARVIIFGCLIGPGALIQFG